jgi:hypothetical protein
MIATGPVTLSDLAHAGKQLWVYCREYGRERDLDRLSLRCPVKRRCRPLVSVWFARRVGRRRWTRSPIYIRVGLLPCASALLTATSVEPLASATDLFADLNC